MAEVTEFPSLAQVLAKHQRTALYWFRSSCECGWSQDLHNTYKTCTQLHAEHQADMWREVCTITTVEQLDQLPAGSILRDANEFTFEKSPDGEGDTPWWYDGDPHDIGEIDLPARLLHNPGWNQ
ncbi:MAG TPA: hypothetical protein VHA37_00860 [Candidatus Saccharimonadales bacterium]|nr:hypothetical protein [Candidatus Saccharimonadales bacterium]